MGHVVLYESCECADRHLNDDGRPVRERLRFSPLEDPEPCRNDDHRDCKRREVRGNFFHEVPPLFRMSNSRVTDIGNGLWLTSSMATSPLACIRRSTSPAFSADWSSIDDMNSSRHSKFAPL